ncbi:unnamed protein product [Sphagnum troendelagicum]
MVKKITPKGAPKGKQVVSTKKGAPSAVASKKVNKKKLVQKKKDSESESEKGSDSNSDSDEKSESEKGSDDDSDEKSESEKGSDSDEKSESEDGSDSDEKSESEKGSDDDSDEKSQSEDGSESDSSQNTNKSGLTKGKKKKGAVKAAREPKITLRDKSSKADRKIVAKGTAKETTSGTQGVTGSSDDVSKHLEILTKKFDALHKDLLEKNKSVNSDINEIKKMLAGIMKKVEKVPSETIVSTFKAVEHVGNQLTKMARMTHGANNANKTKSVPIDVSDDTHDKDDDDSDDEDSASHSKDGFGLDDDEPITQTQYIQE